MLTADVSHVFSGRANGRRYRADLELQASIDAESCSWEMRCNQPVLKLVKQQQGYWERFLRNKVLKQVQPDAHGQTGLRHQLDIRAMLAGKLLLSRVSDLTSRD